MRLLQFLDQLLQDQQLTHLILLGDIFDLWVGAHDEFLHRFYPIIRRCLLLKEKGVQVHYFEGNHDFHLRRMFADDFGFTVHGAPYIFTSESARLRVEHGDEMNPNDKGYLFLRWFFRTPVLTWLADHLPGWFVSLLGEGLSKRSRQYTSQTKAIDERGAKEVIRAHAQRVAVSDNIDLVISGHVHVRDEFEFHSKNKTVKSINLGSWLDKPCAFTVTTGPTVQTSWTEL